MLNHVIAGQVKHDREEIQQIRNLLFGEAQRENELRIASLETQLRELRQTMERELGAIASKQATSQEKLIHALAKAVSELGSQIHQIAESTSPDRSDDD